MNPQFSDSSYGFRPKRSAHQALQRSRQMITDGYHYAVYMDLEKFFDSVSHSRLIEILSRTIKDGRVLSLIHRYLNAGVQTTGSSQKCRKDESQDKGTDIRKQRLGQRKAERSLEGVGSVLQAGRYGKTTTKEGRMVSQATANGHLGTMETDKDQICQPDKTWREEIESEGMVKYQKKPLAYR